MQISVISEMINANRIRAAAAHRRPTYDGQGVADTMPNDTLPVASNSFTHLFMSLINHLQLSTVSE